MKTTDLIYQTRHRLVGGDWTNWHDAQDEAAMNRVVALLEDRGIDCESRAVPQTGPLH